MRPAVSIAGVVPPDTSEPNGDAARASHLNSRRKRGNIRTVGSAPRNTEKGTDVDGGVPSLALQASCIARRDEEPSLTFWVKSVREQRAPGESYARSSSTTLPCTSVRR